MQNNDFFEELEQHSLIKIKLLQEYLIKWIRKITLGLQQNCLICDTFAGEGLYNDGTEGSPICILNECIKYFNQPNIKKYDVYVLFVEQDKKHYESLKKNIKAKYNIDIKDDEFSNCEAFPMLHVGTINKTHESFINEFCLTRQLPPSLFFIDPFGFKDSQFSSLVKLMNKKEPIEFVINFMYEEFNRFKSLDEVNEPLSLFFGSDVRALNKEVSLFSPKKRRHYIINQYRNNLENSGIKHTLNFDIQKDNSSAYKMSLVFASNNISGFNVMKETMLDLCKDVSFEYKTKEKKEPTLFTYCEKDFLNHSLATLLYSELKESDQLTKEDIKRYLECHPIIPSGYLSKLLKIMGENGRIYIHDSKGNINRSPKKFSDNTIIYFN